MAKAKSVEVAMNRRAKDERRDHDGDRRVEGGDVSVERRVSQRRKVPRRRQIDPTTCERDYSDDEIQFMHALDAYKRANGRMFPTCSEILEVIRALGYVKVELTADNSTGTAQPGENGEPTTAVVDPTQVACDMSAAEIAVS